MTIVQRLDQAIDAHPAIRWSIIALLVALFAGAGWYFLRLGVRAIRTGEFPNQRTGEMIRGRFALFCAVFTTSVGILGWVGAIGLILIGFGL